MSLSRICEQSTGALLLLYEYVWYLPICIWEYSYIQGVIKKFVDWCDEINTYLAMFANFVGDIKQQMFY